MLFADILFLYVFLPLCLAAYFLVKDIRYKNLVLIVFSLMFYAWGEPVKVLLLVLSAFLNYAFAIMIELHKGDSEKKAKFYLVLALIYNIGMLAVFKYTDFTIGNINALFGTSIPLSNIALPLGISFYTFQIISYVIDVYWDKVPAQRDVSKVLLYVSLFPQLVAGPIVRYETIAKEIDDRRSTVSDICDGFTRTAIGLAKKVILANTLSLAVSRCFGDNIAEASVTGLWLGVVCYAMQVYFDFSGYSDMAIGMGRIFGFHFEENFNYPFMSGSITEFWQRWHISLGSFFRDYLLYVPIFGKRIQVVSLFLVWFCTGLWHGASWNFVLWGLYFGVFIFIESKLGKKRLRRVPPLAMHIFTLIVVTLGFGIFYFEDLGNLGLFFKGLLGFNGNAFINYGAEYAATKYLFVIIIALFACFPFTSALKRFMKHTRPAVRGTAQIFVTAYAVLLLVACSAILVETHATNNPFIYFRF